MNNSVQKSQFIFNSFGHLSVRAIDLDGEIWFVAADVCCALEISNPSMAISRLDQDEVMTLTNSEGRAGSGAQAYNIINESGLYSLVLRSRKAEAKRFKKWVTSEVLPSIRKTGAYQANTQSSGLIDPQRKLHLRRLVEIRAIFLKCTPQRVWTEVRFVTGAGSIHDFNQAQYEQAVAYLGGFPLRGQSIERLPVTVSVADARNFSSFMRVFRQIVDDAEFLREMANLSGSSKMLSLWSLIDSAHFMSGSAQRMEARLSGVGMEARDVLTKN